MDRLVALIYDELHAMAHRELDRWRPGQTLNTTGLIHETYLKLVDQPQAGWQDRTHFLSVAAVAMRHIVVDYARRRGAKKRAGGAHPIRLDESQVGVEVRIDEIIAVDEALTALAAANERLSKVVELRFFGGLTVEETAEVLGVSERTVKREWRKARAFLYRVLGEGESNHGTADG